MAKLSYINNPITGHTLVRLDGQSVGKIVPVKGGFQYWPQGKKRNAGETFKTMQDVKNSLESD